MRKGTFFALAILAIQCGGDGGTQLQHPTLDQDYASNFARTWDGSAPWRSAAARKPRPAAAHQAHRCQPPFHRGICPAA
jgi:hypothetical protein